MSLLTIVAARQVVKASERHGFSENSPSPVRTAEEHHKSLVRFAKTMLIVVLSSIAFTAIVLGCVAAEKAGIMWPSMLLQVLLMLPVAVLGIAIVAIMFAFIWGIDA